MTYVLLSTVLWIALASAPSFSVAALSTAPATPFATSEKLETREFVTACPTDGRRGVRRDPSGNPKLAQIVINNCTIVGDSIAVSGANSSLDLSGLFLDVVLSYPDAATLNFAFNRLKHFPSDASITSARSLILRGNQFRSLLDVAVPPKLEYLDLTSCEITTLGNKTTFPQSLIKLRVSDNKLITLRGMKLPSRLRALEINNQPLASLEGATLPTTLEILVAVNTSLTALNASAQLPQSLVSLDISSNRLAVFPDLFAFPSITDVNVSSNAIRSIVGIRFPWTLQRLDVRGNPLAELEITRSDLALFQMWSYLLPPLTQPTCRSTAARRVRVLNADLCVLEDADFTRVYGKSPSWRVGEDESGDGDVASASPPAIPQPVKPAAQTSQRTRSPFTWATLIPAIVVIAVVVIGVISTISWRHQQLRRKVKNLLARNSHMRTSSFNGDLLRAVGLEGELMATRFDADDIKIVHLLSKHGHCLLFLGAMRDFQNDTNDGLAVTPTRPMDESDQCSTTVSLPDLQAFGQHQLVMLKRIVPEHCNDSSAPLRRFVQEIQLLSQLDHPKVLALRGVCWNTLADVTMVLEYAANGDLRTLLRVDSDRVARRGPQSSRLRWTEPTRSLHTGAMPSKCSIAVDVAEALVYLHSSAPPVLHCGLQARHVFLNDRYEAKLSNIGAPLDVTTTAALDSVAWIAPEILRGERYTEKTDMYAFGILLTELATGATPFDGLASAAIVVRVAHDHERPSLEDATDCPDLIVQFAQRCMRADASERPSALDAHRELLAVRRILRSDLDLI